MNQVFIQKKRLPLKADGLGWPDASFYVKSLNLRGLQPIFDC